MKFSIKIILLFLLILADRLVIAQGIVMSNNANIVLQNNAFVVLENSGQTPKIDTINGGGQLISESENNTLRWHIKNATGNFNLPFGTRTINQGGNGIKIPLSFNITTAGSVGGYLDLSTYETTTDANVPYPSGVTNLFTGSSVDNSLKVIDRFWKIDTNNYTTAPVMTINIAYDNTANEVGGTNTLVESNLFAQNWNASLSKWMFGSGVANTTTHKVENISTATSGFHSFWTLVDNTVPLPITLLNFNAYKIESSVVKLDWQTASEINNDYFTIARSADGFNWTELFKINGKGNSNQLVSYTINDKEPLSGISYYRLKQTDFDGVFTYSKIVSVKIEEVNSINIYPNPAISFFTIKGKSKELSYFQLFNSIGQDITNTISIKHSEEEKIVNISALENGIYFIKTQTNWTKIVIGK